MAQHAWGEALWAEHNPKSKPLSSMRPPVPPRLPQRGGRLPIGRHLGHSVPALRPGGGLTSALPCRDQGHAHHGALSAPSRISPCPLSVPQPPALFRVQVGSANQLGLGPVTTWCAHLPDSCVPKASWSRGSSPPLPPNPCIRSSIQETFIVGFGASPGLATKLREMSRTGPDPTPGEQ